MFRLDSSYWPRMEADYPRIMEHLHALEAKEMPVCPQCGTSDTAEVHVGVIGRTILMTAASTRFHLRPNDRPGSHFCNSCRGYFGDTKPPR